MCEGQERGGEVIKKEGGAAFLSLSSEIGSGCGGLARKQCTSGVTHHTLISSKEAVTDCYEVVINNGKDDGFLDEKDGSRMG